MTARSPASGLPSLDVLLKSLNTMEQNAKAQPKLWDPQLQTGFIGGKASPGSPETAKALLAVPANQQPDLFLQNYIRPADGLKDLQTSLANAADSHKKATVAAAVTPTEHQCKVFPPLLVRYGDPKGQDTYVPVELMAGAELRYTRSFPDLVLNFHADTQAVTVTVCQINANKWPEYELAMQVLYSLVVTDPEKLLTVTEFSALYDNMRYDLLRRQALVSRP